MRMFQMRRSGLLTLASFLAAGTACWLPRTATAAPEKGGKINLAELGRIGAERHLCVGLLAGGLRGAAFLGRRLPDLDRQRSPWHD